jgi:hypothetical protein
MAADGIFSMDALLPTDHALKDNRQSNTVEVMKIPRYFCWTRFGTEAAQEISQIIERKEEERQFGSGVFLWGIGNAVGPSILELLRVSACPQVLFSSIKSAPKSIDVNPPTVVAWTDAFGLDGEPFVLPERALVTSRFDPTSPKRVHYALVCHSKDPLTLSPNGASLQFSALRNLVTKRRLGASQVTAVVEHEDGHPSDSESYRIAIQARLVAPYFIRLHQPIPLNPVNDRSKTFDFAAAREAILLRRKSVRPHQMGMGFASR